MSNILKLKRMGCDFWNDDSISKYSDLENYRLRLSFIDVNGVEVHGDIGSGYKWRHTMKNGKPIKKSVIEHSHMLSLDLQYECEAGTFVYNPKETWQFIKDNDLRYNKIDLLKFINHFSKDKYQSIEIEEDYKHTKEN